VDSCEGKFFCPLPATRLLRVTPSPRAMPLPVFVHEVTLHTKTSKHRGRTCSSSVLAMSLGDKETMKPRNIKICCDVKFYLISVNTSNLKSVFIMWCNIRTVCRAQQFDKQRSISVLVHNNHVSLL
jgi:hypothetical protein